MKYTRLGNTGLIVSRLAFGAMTFGTDAGAIGARRRATPAQVALAWLLAKPYVSTILLGASKLSQLEDNLGTLNVELTPEELRELDAATAPAPLYPNWFQAKTLDAPAAVALGAASSGR